MIWNKGLSKETSQKILEISKKISNNAKINPNYGMKNKHQTENMKKSLRENKIRAEKIRNTMKQKFILGKLKIPDNRGRKLDENFKDKLRKRKTKSHCKNISLGLLKGFKEGKIKVWSTGLTAENDMRLFNAKLKSKKTHLKLRNDLNSIYNTDEFLIRKSAGHQGIELNEWDGFMSEKDYLNFNEKFKQIIRKRDNFICLICGTSKNLKRNLDIHHINYDKKLSITENCCSLCIKCHALTNYNRKYWQKFLQTLLTDKYGYKYDLEGNIIKEIIAPINIIKVGGQIKI